MMTIAACLWLGLFPLLNGGSYARITKDKWWIMMILCGITLLCFFADTAAEIVRERRRGNGGVVCAAFRNLPVAPLTLGILLLIWMTASCLAGPYGPETWIIGASVRREGLITQAAYLGLFSLFACSRVKLRPVLLASAVGICAFFAIVMIQRGGGNPLGLYPRGRSYASNPEFQGTIGNIDMDAGYLCLMAGFFLYCVFACREKTRNGRSAKGNFARENLAKGRLAKRSRGKCRNDDGQERTAPVCLILCGLGLAFSVWLIVSMDVQFAIFTVIGLFLTALLRFLPRKARVPALLLLVLLALALVWLWPGTNGPLWEAHEILHGRMRPSFGHNRAAVWFYSAKLARERPIMGGGSDTFVYRFNEYLEKNGYTIPMEQDGVLLPTYFDNPHNEYLAQLVNHGLPAMMLFMALIGMTVVRGRKYTPAGLSPWAAGACGYALQAFFSFSVCLVAPMFWVMMGIANETRGT